MGLNFSQWNAVRRQYEAGTTDVAALARRYRVEPEMIESYLLSAGLIKPVKQRKRAARNGNNDTLRAGAGEE
jgi:hypothetical protein